MKRYTKRQLATKIIESNSDIFIPADILLEDLEHIYKIRKIAKKILAKTDYSQIYLKNLWIISNNVFGQNVNALLEMIMTETELAALYSVLNN